jgi:hypothetical protein
MIPVYWITKGDVPARTRWDEMFVESIIEGHYKHPAGLQPVEHHIGLPKRLVPFGVVIFPAGAHEQRDLAWLNQHLRVFRKVILFITSDEGSKFTPLAIKHRDLDLWVMTPRPEIEYPRGTTFIGEGSGPECDDFASMEKDLDWFFAGQATTERRKDCVEALAPLPGGRLFATGGFMEGWDRSDYAATLARAKVAPCPSGAETQDSFRLYEALERGCVPVVDEFRNDGGGEGFWKMLDYDPILRVRNWDEFPALLEQIKKRWPLPAVQAHAWWHLKRRELVRTFIKQCPDDEWGSDEDRDAFTVLIPTSPIPEHPTGTTIGMTIQSIRERTNAEILVMVDGVRPEQRDRWDAYYEYVRRLCLHCERIPNVTPVVYYEHLHQAEMTRRTLELVDTPFILYVEHDTPLQGDIPFGRLLMEMHEYDLNLIRFSHESHILAVHHHLIPDLTPHGYEEKWVKTLQWSQRPHIARRSFYRHILDDCFDPTARSMIEDVMHGVTEHDALNGDQEVAWEKWRLAVYHPEGNIQRSGHLDGRSGDPKYPMHFAYPGGRIPTGAPWPTKLR